MKRKGLLMVMSGPSGAGKGTLCKAFLERNDSVRLSVSSTTRQPREQEVDGVSYHFISKERFEEMIRQEELLEYVHVFDNYYGTGKKWVEDCLSRGEDVLLEIEIVGAKKIKEKYPQALLIFILPPSLQELKERIENRGTETQEQIEGRLQRAMEEIGEIGSYDYFVINDRIEEALDEMEAIITAEKNRVDRYQEEIVSRFRNEREEKLS